MKKNLKSNMISSTVHEDIKRRLDESFEKRTETADNKEVAGWFMGTRGENLSEVSEIILSVLNKMVGGRELLYPNDPNYITPNVKLSEGYKQAIASVKHHTNHLLEILNKYSLPTQSLRYQGHMLWDVTLPSVIGYFAAMLQNQNNVTPQASPATTILELLASNDIARMAGFKTLNLDEELADENEVNSWSHISSCGSVADIESVWAAREVKFLPLGIKYALENDELLKPIAGLLKMPGSDDKLLVSASTWELLNLEQDDILALPYTIMHLLPHDRSKNDDFLGEIWSLLASKYSFNALGTQFFSKYMAEESICAPTIIVPSTKHYSWQKAASMLGMGNGKKGLKEEDLTKIDCIRHDGLINVYVDSEGKVNTRLLEKVLTTCRDNKKPVVMVVGVMGTTEEGAVDPMEKILEIRDNFRAEKENLFDYSVHADAAWGGYFLTCWRNEYRMEDFLDDEKKGSQGAEDIFEYSDTFFRKSVYDSMTSIRFCDSATIDPHKMGYIVYPAGSLVYRNDRIVNLITFSAPYISSGINTGNINTRNIGECGIEGSKSGASPASVYLSHAVIRPDRSGYGKIIHQSMLNS
ncbi:MAG: pyridoxal-dependent decarboxylase, partial [Bacteroidales bacterium]|nr:pyridoxal-dependent decarboxylase [Bacteroidales bacterium]